MSELRKIIMFIGKICAKILSSSWIKFHLELLLVDEAEPEHQENCQSIYQNENKPALCVMMGKLLDRMAPFLGLLFNMMRKIVIFPQDLEEMWKNWDIYCSIWE